MVAKKSMLMAALLFLASVLSPPAGVDGAETPANGTLVGQVTDVSGKPVAGVEIYAYDNKNIRRPADFISPPSSATGEYRISLPPGRFWVIARLRKIEQKYGPLLPGDKHSGAPLEVDITAGEEWAEDFVIADLKETSRLAVKVNTAFIKVEGVLLDKNDKPVSGKYVFANRQAAAKKIPDYIGPWTGPDGKFTLYLPEGSYHVGQAKEYPPGLEIIPAQQLSVDSEGEKIYLELRQ